MYCKGRSTQTLDGENGETDEEDVLSTTPKRKLLDSSNNPYWRGYAPRRHSKVPELHKRKGEKLRRERSAIRSEVQRYKQEDKERTDLRDGVSWGEAFQDMSEIPSTSSQC